VEEAAVSQTVRNWKLLSDLKQTASSVHLKGEEARADFSLFSRQNLYAENQQLPAYERLINRVTFTKSQKPLHLQTRFFSFFNAQNFKASSYGRKSKSQSKLFGLLGILLICVLTLLLVILI